MKRSFFEDNDLVDWLIELGESRNASGFITRSVKRVQRELEEEEYVDSLPAGIVLGLGETFAALRGIWSPSFPADVLEKLGRMKKRDWEPMVAEYLKLLDRIDQQCEIKELWEEGGFGADWASAISDLKDRLTVAPEAEGLARQKRVRYQTGDIFRIDLPDGTHSHGKVINHKSILVKIFEKQVSLANILAESDQSIPGFTVTIYEDALKMGTWPIVSRSPSKTFVYVDRYTFRQEGNQFMARVNYKEQLSSARECFLRELAARWQPASIITRIVEGMDSPSLRGYWPRCVDANGELVPKWWSHWTEEDFLKMEQLAAMSSPPLA